MRFASAPTLVLSLLVAACLAVYVVRDKVGTGQHSFQAVQTQPGTEPRQERDSLYARTVESNSPLILAERSEVKPHLHDRGTDEDPALKSGLEPYYIMPMEALEAEVLLMEELLDLETQPLYEELYQIGRYTLDGKATSGEPYRIPVDNDKLESFRFLPGGDVIRIEILEEDAPEQFKLRRKIIAVKAIRNERRHMHNTKSTGR